MPLVLFGTYLVSIPHFSTTPINSRNEVLLSRGLEPPRLNTALSVIQNLSDCVGSSLSRPLATHPSHFTEDERCQRSSLPNRVPSIYRANLPLTASTSFQRSHERLTSDSGYRNIRATRPMPSLGLVLRRVAGVLRQSHSLHADLRRRFLTSDQTTSSESQTTPLTSQRNPREVCEPTSPHAPASRLSTAQHSLLRAFGNRQTSSNLSSRMTADADLYDLRQHPIDSSLSLPPLPLTEPSPFADIQTHTSSAIGSSEGSFIFCIKNISLYPAV